MQHHSTPGRFGETEIAGGGISQGGPRCSDESSASPRCCARSACRRRRRFGVGCDYQSIRVHGRHGQPRPSGARTCCPGRRPPTRRTRRARLTRQLLSRDTVNQWLGLSVGTVGPVSATTTLSTATGPARPSYTGATSTSTVDALNLGVLGAWRSGSRPRRRRRSTTVRQQRADAERTARR